MVSAPIEHPFDTALRPARSRFFVGMSILLLAIVLAGFTPTLYLRPYIWPLLPDYFDPGYGVEQPMHLYVHGIVLTAWFLLAAIQPSLVATRRTVLHRRLGVAGIATAVGVVVVSLYTIVLRDAPVIDEFPRRGVGNLMLLVAFLICVTSAVMLRHRPAAHKRLMLFASLSIISPALDRIGNLPPLYERFGAWFPTAPPEIVFALICNWSLVIVMLVHDLMSRKRPHWATIWGICTLLVIAPAISQGLAFTGLWTAFVRFFS